MTRERCVNARPGQSTVEFALISLVFLGLLLAVIDLGRAGFVQHNLDSAAADLAQRLGSITGANSTGSPYTYTPTPLDPTSAASATYTAYQGISTTVPLAIQAALVHARGIANNAFSGATLAPAGGGPFVSNSTTTISNTQVTVVGAPNLTAPTEITVTVTTTFNPVVGTFLKGKVFRLQAREAVVPVPGSSM